MLQPSHSPPSTSESASGPASVDPPPPSFLPPQAAPTKTRQMIARRLVILSFLLLTAQPRRGRSAAWDRRVDDRARRGRGTARTDRRRAPTRSAQARRIESPPPLPRRATAPPRYRLQSRLSGAESRCAYLH